MGDSRLDLGRLGQPRVPDLMVMELLSTTVGAAAAIVAREQNRAS